ncbi:MAG TPA: hypothetical protein VGS07_13195 [Thermoanaerobaculia bacterium]|nr:hypothetical protein [Thermoanaerobaculia bacterium]
MQKKSGFILAALALFAFALVSSPAAPPSAAAALQAAQTVQAPVPSPVQSPLTPTANSSPLNLSSPVGLPEPQPACRCSKNSQCGTGACCWWPHQSCGICC